MYCVPCGGGAATGTAALALGSWFSADPIGFMLIVVIVIVTLALGSWWSYGRKLVTD